LPSCLLGTVLHWRGLIVEWHKFDTLPVKVRTVQFRTCRTPNDSGGFKSSAATETRFHSNGRSVRLQYRLAQRICAIPMGCAMFPTRHSAFIIIAMQGPSHMAETGSLGSIPARNEDPEDLQPIGLVYGAPLQQAILTLLSGMAQEAIAPVATHDSITHRRIASGFEQDGCGRGFTHQRGGKARIIQSLIRVFHG
jgi:hypothetical protein